MFGHCCQEASGRPAFLVGLSGKRSPHQFYGGQPELGEEQLDAGRVIISVLLLKALNDQGFAVNASLVLTSIVYAASFFGKGFTGFLMEIIGRRWTIAYALTGSLPGADATLAASKW
jgi:hypothetical protein